MEDMTEFEVNMITEMPPGSKGIITSFLNRINGPHVITKEEMEEFIEKFKKNPQSFKRDYPRR